MYVEKQLKKPLALVRVTWIDTVEHETGWHEFEELKDLKTCIVHSIGYLARQDDKQVTLIADWIPSSEEFGRSTSIPKGCITNIQHVNITD